MELFSRLHKRKSSVPNKSGLVGCKLEKLQSVTVWTERWAPWEDRKQSKVPWVKSSSVRNLGKSDTWTHRSAPSRRPPPPPPTGRHLLRPHYQYHRNTRPGSSPCSIIQPLPLLLTGLATAAHGESGGGVLIAGGGNPGMLEAGVPLKRAATSRIMTQN